MISYNNTSHFRILLRMHGSVIPKCLPLGFVTGTFGLILAITRKIGRTADVFQAEKYIDHHFAIKVLSVVLGYLLVTRANMALQRWNDGISGIQSMLSYWTDANNQISAFLSGKDVKTQADAQRLFYFRIRIAHYFALMSCLAIVRLRASGVEGSEMDHIPINPKNPMRQKKRSMSGRFVEVADTGDEAVRSLDLTIFHAPTPEEVKGLEQCSDKVTMLCYWILQSVMAEVRSGVLDTPPPVTTRIYAEVLFGMQAFHQSLKIAQVPFPFPFAQMVSVLLCMFYVCIPLYIDVFTANVVMTPLISAIIPMCYCGLNNVSVELEEPFGLDANDVDVEERHEAFVKMMEDVLTLPMVTPASTGDMTMEAHIIQGYAARASHRGAGKAPNGGGWAEVWTKNPTTAMRKLVCSTSIALGEVGEVVVEAASANS